MSAYFSYHAVPSGQPASEYHNLRSRYFDLVDKSQCRRTAIVFSHNGDSTYAYLAACSPRATFHQRKRTL